MKNCGIFPKAVDGESQASRAFSVAGECIVHVIASLTFPDGRTWKDEVPDVAMLGFADTVAALSLAGRQAFSANPQPYGLSRRHCGSSVSCCPTSETL